MSINRLEIDISKMSEHGRLLYLQDLLNDSLEAIKDLAGNEPRHDYIKSTIEHLEQATGDLLTMKGIY
jgi:hypothetical protein